MKVFPDRLSDALKGPMAKVYLVAGPEALLLEESLDLIRQAAKAQGVVERVVVEADGRFDWTRLGQATETGSLFAMRRLVELRLPSGKPGKEGALAIREWIAAPGDDVLLIKCAAWDLTQEKSVWFKSIDEAGVFVPCWTIKPHQLPQWITSRLASKGLSADRSGVTFLAQRMEGNVLAAAQEVERLALLHPKGHRLTLAELKQSVVDHARFDPFRLVELVLTAQSGPALRCIRGLMEAGVPGPAVVFALARELEVTAAYQVLIKKQSAQQIFRDFHVWPARQGPIEAVAKRLSPKNIALALAELSKLDRMSKSNDAHQFWVSLERLCVGLADTNHFDFVDDGMVGRVA